MAQAEAWQPRRVATRTRILVALNVRSGAILSALVYERPADRLSIRQYVQGIDSFVRYKPDLMQELGPLQAHPLRSQLLRLAWKDAALKQRWKGLRAFLVRRWMGAAGSRRAYPKPPTTRPNQPFARCSSPSPFLRNAWRRRKA